MALGGGCELMMHCSAAVVHAELMVGLPEARVGIVPGWGGCTRMLARASAAPASGGGPAAVASRVFETLSMATLSRSALEAGQHGYLRATDTIVMNPDRVLAAARDQALAMSGLLSDKTGGAPVKPYQPAGVWEEATFGKKLYAQDQGESLYRRSLYTFWRRIIAPTMFFDAANRAVCTVKPLRTNTPLHALNTLNDPTYVEAARMLAQRVWSAGDDRTRLLSLFQLLLAREPSAPETELWTRALQRQRAAYAADEPAAKKLLAIGAAPRDPTLPLAEHAAYTALCLSLLNLDETLTKE